MPKLAHFVAPRSALEIARISAHAMDGVLAFPAELWVSIVNDEAVLLGTFQRATEVAQEANARTFFHRASGGPALRIGPGAIHLALTLEDPATLTPCDPPRLVNRYVRPLLRALASLGEKAAYFGRDWVSVQHRPLAWAGFAHDSTTRRSVFEAVIGVSTPWSLDYNRASFLGKSEITLQEAVGHSLETEQVARVIAAEYATAFGGGASDPPEIAAMARDVVDEPNWRASLDEAIGIVAAGRDRNQKLRIGGQFLASRDAIARLESRVAAFDASTETEALGRAVDVELTAPGIALHGIKSLRSMRDVIAEALRI